MSSYEVAKELSDCNIDLISGGGIDPDLFKPPVLSPWDPLPTGTGPYGGDPKPDNHGTS